MRLSTSISIAFGAALLFGGCASTQSRFDRITPEMSQDDVRQTMSEGPTRFQTVVDTPYSAWYWGDDYCVLFRGGKVISKDSSQSGRNANVGGGSYEEHRSPQCVAPGQVATSGTKRSIKVPGFGSIELPSSRLRDDAHPGDRRQQGGSVGADRTNVAPDSELDAE